MRQAVVLAALLLTGCVTGGPIVATAGSCSDLVPDSWRLGVDGADLPEGTTVADWIAFGDAQTGKLDAANGRTADVLHIVSECEKRDALAVRRSRPRLLGLF